MAHVELTPGTIIAGLYRADRRIGAGGMGEVWAGVRLSDDMGVAIKVLLPNAYEANEVHARFRREAQVLALVRSAYVAQVLDFLTEEDGLVLVMELIPGDSLHAILSYDQALVLETTLDIASDVLRGLRDLHHANIVHRDLKPGNIVLRPRPGLRPRATLIDFGVSRIMSDPDEEEVTAITRGDRVLGTLEYMAPEQILGSRTVTGTADLYAVGAMMFRAIMGHHVFGDLQEGHLAVAKLNKDAPPLDINRTDEIAERTQAFLSRLLSRRLRDRYKTAEEALEEVDSIRDRIPNRVRDEQSLSGEEPTLDNKKKALSTSVESSNSISQIEIVEIRAAIPIEEELQAQPPKQLSPQPAPPTPDVPQRKPSSRRVETHPLRTLGVAFVLFIFGSAGGGMFGVSYARGGLAYEIILPLLGQDHEHPARISEDAAETPIDTADVILVDDLEQDGLSDAGDLDAGLEGEPDVVTTDATLDAEVADKDEKSPVDASSERVADAKESVARPRPTLARPPRSPSTPPPTPKPVATPRPTSEPEPKEPVPLLPEEP